LKYPVTSDGRYFAVRGRLWRMTDPAINEEERSKLTKQLMAARRAVRDAKAEADADAEAAAALQFNRTVFCAFFGAHPLDVARHQSCPGHVQSQ
jgi:hypothetical protein